MFAAALAALTLTACGAAGSDTKDNKNTELLPPQTTLSQESSTADEPSDTSSQGSRKPASASIGENGAKAVTRAMLVPDEEIDISDKVSFEDLFGRHVLHSAVVGLVGAPVEVDFDTGEISGGTLIFDFDPEKLEGVRPDALMFMWYDEENGYVEFPDTQLDAEKNAVAVHIDKPGTYLLVNRYVWYAAWGEDTGDNGMEPDFDPDSYISPDMWAANDYTGDIIDLADMDYIKRSVSESGSGMVTFKVSNPSELASACYYVNCSKDGSRSVVELQSDIDLAGIKWAGFGWSAAGVEYDYGGFFNGNGHTIRNLTCEGGYSSPAGLISTAYGATVSDLRLENVQVSGSPSGAVIGYDRMSVLIGCSASGNCDGGGTLVGYSLNTSYSGCSAEMTVDGKKPEGNYLSMTDAEKAEAQSNNAPTETITLGDDYIVRREEGIETRYDNLQWHIERDGERVLERGAENETELPRLSQLTVPGHYKVCLQAFVDGYYIPVSNTVEFDIVP